jgi:palmitoyltransferase ZDHHC13/17
MNSKREDLKNAIEAVQFGDMQTVRQMINEQIVSANSTDDDECTLAHWAAINNRNALLVYLIEHGAKVNVLGGVLMESPLHWAVRKNFFRTVKILIQNGADPSLQSRDGVSPLLLACTLGNVEMSYFLIAHGADVNGINSLGDSLLMTLLKDQECSKLDVFRLIIRLGADGTFKDRQDGNTILHVMNTRRTKDHHKLAFVLYEAAGQELLSVKNFHDQTPRDVLNSTRNYIMLRFYGMCYNVYG